ncbi:MAG: hypothetical protein JNL01_06955 [Bdellovibrionales bacterium]|nr:hypothetical protein [Bdellovibrionales bacterium]
MNWVLIMISAFFGALVAAVIGSALRILLGMRLNLILINHDSSIRDQSFIPVTTENKKNSLWRSLTQGNWREDVEITVADDHGHLFIFQVGFHWWNRYWMKLLKMPEEQEDSHAKLNGQKILIGQKIWARTSDRLDVGDRRFYLLVTPEPIRPDMHHDLYEAIK